MSASKVAIVAAGGSGMGAGTARKLAADGFQVAILSSSGKGEALAAELGGIGVTGSNQSNDDLTRLVDRTMARWGRVDVLVNSAGHGPRGGITELSDDDWHRGMEVYFLNVARPTRLVTPVMRAQKSGVIINISSFSAVEPDPAFPTSSVFRAGLAKVETHTPQQRCWALKAILSALSGTGVMGPCLRRDDQRKHVKAHAAGRRRGEA